MLNNVSKYNIILASNSPRRKELLAGLGLNFTVKTIADIDESYPEHLKGSEIAEHISLKKAKAYEKILSNNDLIITADTIVWSENKVLGKPKDKQNAIEMIKTLSGKTHIVYTAVSITTTEWQKSFTTASEVLFDNLTDEEIEYYVDHYKPFDKAGAYGIQEWIGYIAVKSIKGSFYNIIGLPVQRLYTELKSI